MVVANHADEFISTNVKDSLQEQSQQTWMIIKDASDASSNVATFATFATTVALSLKKTRPSNCHGSIWRNL